jgi:hypothetical protein
MITSLNTIEQEASDFLVFRGREMADELWALDLPMKETSSRKTQ